MGLTTISVRPETLARLRGYKSGGASYDEVLNRLMDTHPPHRFVREHLRRLREESRVSWSTVKRRQKL
jgi:predicted CopG family antitoxin